MQHLIKIKGKDKPLVATPEQVEQIKPNWNHYVTSKKDSLFTVDGKEYHKVSSIYSIEKDQQQARIDNRKARFMEEADRAREERKAFLKLTPEQKAENVGLAKIIYWGFGLGNLEESPTDLNAVKTLQKAFYEENPDKMYPDPFIFKKIAQGREMNALAWAIVKSHVVNDR